MIPLMAFVPKPVTTLPITDSHVFYGQFCQCFLQFFIVFCFCCVLTGSAGYPYQFTRLAVTQLFIGSQVINSFPFLLGR